MATKEQIYAEVDRVGDEHLDELYQLVKDFTNSKTNGSKPGLMSQLRTIKIEAPEDFSENFDLYASGEKRVEDNLR